MSSSIRSTTSAKAIREQKEVGKDKHLVKKGETLAGIANQYGTDTSSMMKANPQVKDKNRIFAGSLLNIPAGKSKSDDDGTYVIKEGDTLGEIAQEFDTSVDDLMKLNPSIKDADTIYAGDRIAVKAVDPDEQGAAPAGDNVETPEDAAGADAASSAPPEQASEGVEGAEAAGAADGEAAIDQTAVDEAAAQDAGPTGPHRDRFETTGGGVDRTRREVITGRANAGGVEELQVPDDAGPSVEAAALQAANNAGKASKSRIKRAVQKPIWKQLAKGQSQDAEISLGSFANAKVTVENNVVELPGKGEKKTATDALRQRFTNGVAKAGKETMWLESKGTIDTGAEAKFGDGRTGVGIDGELSYTLTRPYVHDKKSPDGTTLAKDLAANNSKDLPVSHENARALEPGSTFTMAGRLGADAGVRAGPAGASADASLNRSVHVERLEGDYVAVTTRKGATAGLDADASLKMEQGAIQADAGARRTSRETERYLLDLSKPEGQKAYGKLMVLDGRNAKRSARKTDSGVQHQTLEDFTARDREVNARLKGGIGGTSVAGNATFESGVMEDRVAGTITKTRNLSGEVALNSTVGDNKVGFTAGKAKRYSLEVPIAAGDDVKPPVDAESAKALPAGSVFSMQGQGAVGFSVDGQTLDAAATKRGAIDLEVKKLTEGNVVEAQVSVSKGRAVEGGVTIDTEKAGISLASDTDIERVTTGRIKLDLDKPEHAKAYDALIKGDLGPAKALGEAEGTWGKRLNWERSDTAKVRLAPTDWANAAVELSRGTIPDKDKRVAQDPVRQQFAKETPGDVDWVEARGAIEPGVKFTATKPVSGVVNAKVGFSANGMLAYSSVRPAVDGEVKGPLLPPVEAEDAQKLAPGTEFSLHGRGTLGVSAGVSAGPRAEILPGAVSVGADVGVEHERTRTHALTVNAKKGAGDAIDVRVTARKAKSAETTLSARAGLDSNFEGVLNQGVLKEAAQKAQVDRRLEKVVSAEINHSRRNESSNLLDERYPLDLSKPGHKPVYEALLRGDFDGARKLAKGADIPVHTVKETSDKEQVGTNVDIAGKKVLLSRALREGKYRIETQGDSRAERGDLKLQREYKGAVSGLDLKVGLDAVVVRTADDPQGKSYVRFQYEGKERFTSKGEVNDVVHLARSLDAVPKDGSIRNEKDKDRGIKTLLGPLASRGETKTKIDMFMTPQGFQNVRKADPDRAIDVYGKHVTPDDPPAWASPKHGPAAREMLEEYARVKKEADMWGHDSPEQSEVDWIESQYYSQFKRNIWEDTGTYDDARAFKDAIYALRCSDDPRQWRAKVQELGKEVRFGFHPAVASFNELAGKDEVLVHELSMKGGHGAVNVEMVDEGLLQPL